MIAHIGHGGFKLQYHTSLLPHLKSLSLLCLYWFFHFSPMEDILASLWNTLSLIENEAITLELDPNILSVPNFSIIGRLAMKKHVNLLEVDKGMKSIWSVDKELETTVVGDNLYLFSFKSERALERILTNQPWNFRGSLMLLDRTTGDVCPGDLVLQKALFWVQIYGLKLGAMKKEVGEAIGSLVGEVVDFAGDDRGRAIGKCVRVWVLIEVSKPLLRWTSVSFGGVTNSVLLRYEKLGDFCYLCGQLDHLEKKCSLFHSEALRYYGLWLRADGHNPLSWNEVVLNLNWLNSNIFSPGAMVGSPRIPTHKGIPPPTADNAIIPSKSRPSHASSPITIHRLNSRPNTPPSTGPNKVIPSTGPINNEKLDWNSLIPNCKSNSEGKNDKGKNIMLTDLESSTNTDMGAKTINDPALSGTTPFDEDLINNFSFC